MFPFLPYWILILFELFFVMGIALYMLSLLYSSIKGSPYVPTKNRQILTILKNVPFKKGMRFLDLGCGDGRVVRLAVQQYKVKGLGIDVNPMVIVWAKLKAIFTHTRGAEYKVENILKTNLAGFDVIYLFLMPEFLTKLRSKLLKETKKKAIVISHGFKIEGWDKYRFKMLQHNPFPTYFYRLTK